MNLKITWVAVLIGLASLAGCSDSTTTPTTQTVNGVVADGYLENAKVCLDLNDNKKCDDGAQTITSTAADGSYSLTNVSADDLKKHALIVEVGIGAINHEGTTGTPVIQAYILSTPPDAPKTADGKIFISPLTTMIHSQMESNPALSVADAEKSVKLSLGATSANLFEDFVQKKGTNPEYDRISVVAQVVANVLGANMDAIKATAPAGTDLKTIISMIVTQVVSQLQTITLPTTSADFDPTKITISVKNDFDKTPSTTTPPVTVVASNSVKNALTTGVSSFNYDGNMYIIQETVKLSLQSAGSYALTSPSLHKMTGTLWEANTQVKSYRPTLSGWTLLGDSADTGTVVFNSDNSATWTNKDTGDSQKIQISSLDLTGKLIASSTAGFMTHFPNITVDATANFSAGAAAYTMTMTPLQDQYIIGSNNNPTNFTSVDAVIQSLAVSPLHVSMYDDVQMTPGTSTTAIKGDLQLFSTGQPILASGSTWEKRSVKGQDVLIIHIPSAMRSVSHDPNNPGGNPDEDVIYGSVSNVVMKGSVRYANIPRQDKGSNFNATALSDILVKYFFGI